MSAQLVVMRETNLLDIPATLRNIADSIEEGKYGEPVGVALVLEADALELFYTGEGEAGPRAHLLLSAGAAKMMAGILEGKMA